MKFKVVLWMVEAESGISKEQVLKMFELLEEDSNDYMPITIEGESNSVAYGFICSSYYEELGYNKRKISNVIKPVLNDWNLESTDKIYLTSDGTKIYMGCDYETITK